MQSLSSYTTGKVRIIGDYYDTFRSDNNPLIDQLIG